ncbi:MAG: J domain-containing protein [Ramlibacter sp.]
MTRRAATFYELLGVSREATPDDIRTGYRRRAQKFHPDKYRGRGDAAAIMAQINRAYEVLSDAGRRAAYDSDMDASAQGSRVVPVVPLGIGGWPWYVLSATLCMILLAIGWLALRTLAPQRVTYVSGPAAAATPQAQPANAVAAPEVKPWQEPAARAVPLADDPVSRLVRDGVLAPAPPAR